MATNNRFGYFTTTGRTTTSTEDLPIPKATGAESQLQTYLHVFMDFIKRRNQQDEPIELYTAGGLNLKYAEVKSQQDSSF